MKIEKIIRKINRIIQKNKPNKKGDFQGYFFDFYR